MANLLDQASIVLTPTAYNNGEALCVKPTDGSGDFDFSRNSAATRVNAQGLVENVQILSSNLVQNGDFSELGTEEISNGSFSQEGVEIADDSTITNAGGSIMTKVSALNYNATSDGTGSSSIRPRLFFNDVTTGNFYRIRVSGTNQSGSVNFKLYDGNAYIVEDNDLTTDVDLYFEAKGASVFIAFDGTNPFNVDFTISLKEVGQDWTFGTGWSVGEDKAVSDGSQTGNSLLQQASILTLNKTYKVSYELIVTSGSIYARLGFSGAGVVRTTSGTFVEYIECAGNTNFDFLANSSFEGSVTNISVKEVDPNDYWTLGTGWSIGDGVAISDATQGYINQNNLGGAGVTATYKVQWTQNITAGTRLRFFARNYNDGGNATIISITRDDGLVIGGGNCIGNGTFTAYVSSTNGYSFKLLAEAGVEADISNVTTIQITDDTNLPRINYEGFSYQDALGSELVTNGDFSNGSTDWILNDWTVADGKASLLNGSSFINQNNILEVGKTYKIQYTISDYVSGNIRWRSAGVNGSVNTSNGVVTDYITVASTGFGIQGYNGFTGSISNISAKEYSGQEVVPDSGCGSWLFEPQSTNEIEYSNDYTDAYWIKATSGSGIAPVVTSNYAISPDGTQNADRIQFDATTSGSNADRSRIRTTLSLTDTSDYTFSFYAKSTDGTDQKIGILFDNSQIATFTITDEWQRFEDTATQFGTSSICGLDLRSGIASTSDILVYGIQVEEQSYSTSLIPTDGTTVTRNQDVCINGGSLASINSTEGVLYAEIAALADDLTYRMIALSDSDSSDHVRIYYTNSTNKISVAVKSNGSNQYIFLNYNVTDITDYIKIAVKYKANDFATFINGVKVNSKTTTSSAPIGLDRLNFDSGAGATNFFGKTKALAVWKEALSDEELAELTTI